MRKNINKRFRYVLNYEDFKYIESVAKRRTIIAYGVDHNFLAPLRYWSYVQDKERYIELTTMYVKDIVEDDKVSYVETNEKYPCTWIFDKSGESDIKVHPSRVSKIVNNIYKPKELVKEEVKDYCFDTNEDNKIIQSAKPMLKTADPKSKGIEYDNVVVYDLNSAYANVLKDKIIDTYNYRYYDVVGENEVGFNKTDDLRFVEKGHIADIVFPLIDSPYKDFVTKYYNIKKTAPKGSKERAEAKSILNIAVGLWQNHNPFLRAYVVNTCNNYIKNLADKYDKYVVLCNTDAIYATKHIEELDNLVGDDIGQFKIEYEGRFRLKGFNYQKVDTNDTSIRGVLKLAFKQNKDYNLLKDPIPKAVLPYKYNTDKYILEENKDFKELL